ncbi:OmpH family outer membrane protein [Palleronia caenipelagi]|uniref:OmpH family outer membrane protein n=1 Tax=Palleronia caenipelagi TaxID=2489174 RepID=A0A547Q634_9RHOB|nr:OmpH family outer membrane protein [Palleronia caenipelagi]TRD21845.1 OmpH family outer membrane protein [Palleronia caenipelagi]
MSRFRRSSDLLGAALLGLFALVGAAAAQNFGTSVETSVVVVDQEKLFQDSQFGRSLLSELEAQGRTLALENRRIEQALTAEESELTDLRPSLSQVEFRARAARFDQKVTQLRSEQDAKARALAEREEEARQVFFRRAGPTLIALLQEVGAQILLDRRVVLAAVPRVDITDRAISRIDLALGTETEVAPDGSADPDDAPD